VWKKLLERRVPQIVGLYVAGSWGFVQFVDWAVQQYALSPDLVNFAVALLLLLLPMVAWLAWRHGAPGRDGWGLKDGVLIGANLAIAAGILALTFAGRDLGAATTVKVLEDEEGNLVERAVPKAALRKSLLGFEFEPVDVEPDREWLGDGMLLGLEADLIQDPFINLVRRFHPTVQDLLEEAGIGPEDRVPLTLMRQAAEVIGRDHFLTGEWQSEGDTLIVTTRLYETATAREQVERTYRGTDPLEIADRISVDVRRDAGVPEWNIERALDLPAAELLTDSPEALQALAKADAGWSRNDWPGTLAAVDRAIELDSTAALAYMIAVQANLNSGNLAAAREHSDALARFDWRLPERLRLAGRMQSQAFLEMDMEAAIRTGSYWAEVYPQDPMVRHMLAFAYARTGDREAELAQLKAILEIDPTDVEAAARVANSYRATGDYDSALAVLRRRAERVPTDANNRRDIAWTLHATGDLEAAREELEAARIAVPNDLEVLQNLGRLLSYEGRVDEAERLVDEGRAMARADADRLHLVGLEESLAYQQGQFGRLEELYRERLRLASATMPPVDVVAAMPTSEILAYAAHGGREEFALRQLDSLRAVIDAPWSNYVDVAALQIHLDRGDAQAVRETIGRLEQLRKARGGELYWAYIQWANGRLEELEGASCEQTLETYGESRRNRPRNSRYALERARCLRELGRYDEAQAEIDWLFARQPGYSKNLVEASRLAAARGDTDEALAHLDAALETWAEADPEFVPAREARALREEIAGAIAN
jgi:tetratricopeptide (TPR) repeat protein